MEYLIVCAVAMVASALTLVSGFGLGTLLLPAFALFFPVEVAVSATAAVHLLNNLFKLALVGKHARPALVARFGVPAVATAALGAWMLAHLSGLPAVATYTAGGRELAVTPVKLVIAVLMLAFSAVELLPASRRPAFGARWVPLGGALSGFFGGLSGHQGALRSAFLIRAGLSKEAFVGTGIFCAVLVDLVRLVVYGGGFLAAHFRALGHGNGLALVGAASAAAFTGAFVGVRVLGKMTLPGVQRTVALLLALLAAGIGSGWV